MTEFADGVPVYCAHDKIVPLKELKPNPKNPNQHPGSQVKLLADIIKATGWRQPITVSKRSGLIVKGHGRFLAAESADLTEAPVDYQDYASEAEEMADMVADNRIAELANREQQKLAEILSEIVISETPIEQSGYTRAEYEMLSAALETEIDKIKDDADIEPPAEPFTRRGDLWLLGRHRLLCGDSTLQDDVERLMNGDKAELFLTDPPYNVDYVGKTKDMLKIQNDAMSDDDFRLFLETAFSNASEAMSKGAAAYIFHADRKAAEFIEAFRTAGFLYKQMLIWVKNTIVLGRQDYQWKHEPCIYGWKDGATHYFVDDRTQTTVYEDETPDLKKMKKEELLKLLEDIFADKVSTTVIHEEKPLRSELHPTMMPIKLLARLIKNSSRVGDIVLDLFGGSGSTLIACEQLNRVCYTMELDEKYEEINIERIFE